MVDVIIIDAGDETSLNSGKGDVKTSQNEDSEKEQLVRGVKYHLDSIKHQLLLIR